MQDGEPSDYETTGLNSKRGDWCLPQGLYSSPSPWSKLFCLRVSVPQSETLLNSEANKLVPEGPPSPLEVIITLIRLSLVHFCHSLWVILKTLGPKPYPILVLTLPSSIWPSRIQVAPHRLSLSVQTSPKHIRTAQQHCDCKQGNQSDINKKDAHMYQIRDNWN